MSDHQARQPRQSSVAIRYNSKQDALMVVAKGYGSAAQRIIDMAKRHDVHIHESPELVGLLMQVDLDKQIPPALYAIVAELLSWLYNLDSKAP